MVATHLDHDVVKTVHVDVFPTERRHLEKRLSDGVKKFLEPSKKACLPEVARGAVLRDVLAGCS